MVLMFNSTGQTMDFTMPTMGRNLKWNLFVDTAAIAPADIHPDANGPMPPDSLVVGMPHHSMKVYVSGKIPGKGSNSRG
jgi:glycogen operon protein